VAEGKTAGKTRTKPRGVANVRGGKGTATRTVGLLGAILSYAVRHNIRADNPARGVVRFADGKSKRRLSANEYARLGEALRAAEGAGRWQPAIAMIRFLALTGWRSGEALRLLRTELDQDRRTATLPDTKTGYSMRPLSQRACQILRTLPTSGELIFPAARGRGPMSGFRNHWDRALANHGLPNDITPKVLRHSFASLADDLGYSEPTIATLIGHQGRTMTSRYVHSADAALLAAADDVAEQTAVFMGEPAQGAGIIAARRDGG
jgi:integrase